MSVFARIFEYLFVTVQIVVVDLLSLQRPHKLDQRGLLRRSGVCNHVLYQ
jgi:hypothetical protein